MVLVRSTVARLHPLLWRPGLWPLGDNEAVGSLGEKIAGLALQTRGYKILYRNFVGRHDGEADIVCRDGDCLVFVEVKTRTTLKYGLPSEAVTEEKQHLIRRAAKDWLSRLPDPNVPVRIDVVEILLTQNKTPDIHVIQDAFGDA